MPFLSVLVPQGMLCTVPDTAKQFFERHESFAQPKSHSAPQARFVRTAENPSVITRECVRPERLFSQVKRYSLSLNRQISALPIVNLMYGK